MEFSFYKEFKPELTPKKMLEYGVFGGSYLGDTTKEYPDNWFISRLRFSLATISRSVFLYFSMVFVLVLTTIPSVAFVVQDAKGFLIPSTSTTQSLHAPKGSNLGS